MSPRVLGAVAALLAASACGGPAAQGETTSDAGSRAAPSATPSAETAAPNPTETAEPEAPGGPTPSDGRPRRAVLSIPAIDVRVPVVPYEGWTDDAPGTEIQNRGLAASPHGRRGGVGPGGVGNYQVTAHRTSSTRAFELLPEVRRGDRVLVDVRATREDHAAGNYWADEFDNPEHRIDKIGVLVAVRPR